MQKISARKLILCEFRRLYFKRKNNNIRKKNFGAANFKERHSKRKFHNLVKELKLFDYDFFKKRITTRDFDFSQRCSQCSFCFLIGCIQQFHSLIILSNNFSTFELSFFN